MGWRDFWKKKTAGSVDGKPAGGKPAGKVSDGPFEEVWSRAQHAWDERQMHLLVQVRNWQRFAQMSLGVAVVGVLGAMYYAAQPRAVPVYVEVDRVGNVLKVEQLRGAGPVVDINRIVFREIEDFVVNMRSVPGDLLVQKRYKEHVFSRVMSASPAETAVRNFLLRERVPRKVAETQTIEVSVRTKIPVSAQSYSIEWKEQAVSLKGEPFGPAQCYKGLLSWDRVPPTSEAAITANPVGWLVKEWSYSKVEGVTC